MKKIYELSDSRTKSLLLKTTPWSYAVFCLYKLGDGNYMVSGMVYDGLATYEYDNLEEAYSQYREWAVREERFHIGLERNEHSTKTNSV